MFPKFSQIPLKFPLQLSDFHVIAAYTRVNANIYKSLHPSADFVQMLNKLGKHN